MYAFSLLVNSSTMESLLKHLFHIKQLFDSPYMDEFVFQAHSSLSRAFSSLGANGEDELADIGDTADYYDVIMCVRVNRVLSSHCLD